MIRFSFCISSSGWCDSDVLVLLAHSIYFILARPVQASRGVIGCRLVLHLH